MSKVHVHWEDRLTRLSLALLLLATIYGIVAGAVVTMYYDVTPNMGSIEDTLATVQADLYLLAGLISLAHLPIALGDVRGQLWQQAAIRAVVSFGPVMVFLGTDGLVAHSLWWQPISDTDRFHMLHHSVFAGLPLLLGYWLVVRRWWRPATFSSAPALSRRSWLVSGIALLLVIMAVGIMTGLVPQLIFGVTTIIGLLALPVIWRVAG